MTGSSYTIYNASAGAGKTYTLVKNFLSILLKNDSPEQVRSILAVTFTNKAANEMKSRILTWLGDFSNEKTYPVNPALLQISGELGVEINQLHHRAKKSLSYLLHHYSLLSVSTIDKFNLRLMKSFTKELGLSYSFSIELDASEYLKQSIDELIDELGTDNPFAEVILNYIFWKFENETSTDIKKELLFSSQNFLKEVHLDKIISVTDKEIEDFEKLNQILLKRLKANKEQIDALATDVINLIEGRSLKATDFYQGANGMAGFFTKALNGGKINFSSKYYKVFCEEEKYTGAKSVREEEIREIAPLMIQNFYKIKDLLGRMKIDESVRKNLITIELQSEISKFLNYRKEENDVLFLSDVNPIISNHLKNEPTAFIYEKLGGRYNHYFIDEFQDTSQLQWNNFLPLIENAKVSNGTSITLVGDPKQSIYRFRSGKPEILIDLISSAEEQNIRVVNLPDNYRSLPNIVHFNNELYSFLAESVLLNPDYKELFGAKAQQNPFEEEGGRVQVTFVSPPDEDDNYMAEKVLQVIKEALDNGFEFKDIAILVRNKKHSFPIVDKLIDSGFPILTEEALLVVSSSAIQTVIYALRWINNTEDKEQLVFMLYQLAELGKIRIKDFTGEILEIKDQSFTGIIISLKDKYGLELKFKQSENLSFYDFLEELIQSIGFGENEEMYLSALLDMVLHLEKNGIIGLDEFLENWDLQSPKLSVRFPDNMNSIQIMTIHKSKGLEFPIVIYPLISSRLAKEEYWFPLDKELYNGFEKYYASGKTGLEDAGEEIQEVIDKREFEKHVDELCVQYVATTRASQQLFLIEEVKDEAKELTILQKFLQGKNLPFEGVIELYPDNYLQKFKNEKNKGIEERKIRWYSNPWSHKLKVSTEVRKYYSEENKHIKYGNAIHAILAEMQYGEEMLVIIERSVVKGLITVHQKNDILEIIGKIIKNEYLMKYFAKGVRVLNEREILFEGRFYRPDRIIECNGKYTIIDFKTGEKHPSHKKQIEIYALAIESFGYDIEDKLLVYLTKTGEVEFERI